MEFMRKRRKKESNHNIVFKLGDKCLPNHNVNGNINLPKICDIIMMEAMGRKWKG